MQQLSSGYCILFVDGVHKKLSLKLLLFQHTASVFDIRLFLTPLGHARQFIETVVHRISSAE
jgi:hypothetical protein